MKKFFRIFMVACLGLSLAGCKADMGDVEKQAKKMEEIIEEGSVFEDDWEITFKEIQEDYEGNDD